MRLDQDMMILCLTMMAPTQKQKNQLIGQETVAGNGITAKLDSELGGGGY